MLCRLRSEAEHNPINLITVKPLLYFQSCLFATTACRNPHYNEHNRHRQHGNLTISDVGEIIGELKPDEKAKYKAMPTPHARTRNAAMRLTLTVLRRRGTSRICRGTSG